MYTPYVHAALETLVVDVEPTSEILKDIDEWGPTKSHISFNNLRHIKSFAFTQVVSQPMAERILSQLAYIKNRERVLMVWEITNNQERLLTLLSKNVGTGLKELYMMIKNTANEVQSLSFPQI